MKKFLILLLVAALAGYWYWAQQRAAQTPLTDAHAPKAVESVVHLRLPTFALMLNPLKMSEIESRRVATLLHGGLIAVNKNGDASARLAKSWSQDGSNWLFELRDDVRFSGGAVADANAVVSSLCANLQPSSPWAWALKSIKHETSADGKTVRCTGLVAQSATKLSIEQSNAAPWLFNALASPAGWVIANGAVEQPYGVLPGIGPYEIESITADTRVVLRKRAGGVLTAGVDRVVFDYLPDGAVAAARFAQGKLDALDIESPAIVQQLYATGAPEWRFKSEITGRTESAPAERVRVVIVNEKKLASMGFGLAQIAGFKAQYEAAIDRAKIAAISQGLAASMLGSTLLDGAKVRPASSVALPSVELVLNMEPDAYSDLLAASLPSVVGNVKIRYQGLDKGQLVGNLIKGEYDIMLMVIENPVKSDAFWTALFTQGNPFSAFGKGLAPESAYDLSNSVGIQAAAAKIDAEGNWIGVIREPRIMVFSKRLTGVYLSPSGQPNLEAIRVQ